jgi:hypothetical protein
VSQWAIHEQEGLQHPGSKAEPQKLRPTRSSWRYQEVLLSTRGLAWVSGCFRLYICISHDINTDYANALMHALSAPGPGDHCTADAQCSRASQLISHLRYSVCLHVCKSPPLKEFCGLGAGRHQSEPAQARPIPPEEALLF